MSKLDPNSAIAQTGQAILNVRMPRELYRMLGTIAADFERDISSEARLAIRNHVENILKLRGVDEPVVTGTAAPSSDDLGGSR